MRAFFLRMCTRCLKTMNVCLCGQPALRFFRRRALSPCFVVCSLLVEVVWSCRESSRNCKTACSMKAGNGVEAWVALLLRTYNQEERLCRFVAWMSTVSLHSFVCLAHAACTLPSETMRCQRLKGWPSHTFTHDFKHNWRKECFCVRALFCGRWPPKGKHLSIRCQESVWRGLIRPLLSVVFIFRAFLHW